MKDNSTSKKRLLRNDILFIFAMLLIVAVAAVCMFIFKGQGDSVQVTVDGKVYGVYSLNQDAEIDIRTGKDNGQLNRLVISDGKAYIESATCPDKICANHLPVYRDGESIVCLPNGVVITVTIDKGVDSPDVII